MVHFGRQVAVRRFQIRPDENRPAALANLITGPHTNRRQILRFVDGPGLLHCLLHDVVHRTDADGQPPRPHAATPNTAIVAGSGMSPGP